MSAPPASSPATPHKSGAIEPGAPVVETGGLTRSYGRRKALDGVSFSLLAGECLAVFGPNGAGKTTLLRVLAGILKPGSGSARIGGVELPGNPAARESSGFISHGSMLYAALTPLENVDFVARLYGVQQPRQAAEKALDRIGALRYAHSPVRTLSRGQQQRVSIARAIVHSPAVLLLDEPFSGLDETGGEQLTNLLAELRSDGTSMVVVTHNIPEGLRLATHCAIMIRGAFARFDRRAELDSTTYAAQYRSLAANAD